MDAEANFEDIFSDLHASNEAEKLKQIQDVVENYFEGIEIPEHPTIYDHLVLSLRDEDLIATFNWDPLLLQAYLRNRKAGLSMPKLAFLHGNALVGYCLKDKVCGLASDRCRRCGDLFARATLLYPIKEKNYSADLFIANEWKRLEWGFAHAFMITIFGYSCPNSDQEAIVHMHEAWGDKNERNMEQTALIINPNRSEDEARQNWDGFIHTHHYEIHKDFYESWIANHPRRTGEAWWNQYFEAKFITNNPIPRHRNFNELWKWFEQFKKTEGDASR